MNRCYFLRATVLIFSIECIFVYTIYTSKFQADLAIPDRPLTQMLRLANCLQVIMYIPTVGKIITSKR